MTKAAPLDLNDPREAEISRRLEAHYRETFGEGGERLRATGLDLKGKLLDEVYLHLAYLTGSSFEGASLRGADLSSTDLRECSLRGADLSGASLVKAHAFRCDFREANMTECNLTRWGAGHCDFRRANFGGSQMLDFSGHDSDFREADLHGVTLGASTFRGSLVAGMDLSRGSGTLLRPNDVINVGTPEEPRLLRDEDLLEWFRAAGASVDWFEPPEYGNN
jgi:uncharacterized protein YjbI with pentapeptide repeats